KICGLRPTNTGKKLDKEFLISELQRFVKEFDRIPMQSDFDKLPSYPSRKTFANSFGKFNDALRAAGFTVKEKPEYTKEYLLSEIQRFISEFGKQPYSREMDNAKGYPSKHVFERVFGSWNNAIKDAGLKVRVSQYKEEELDEAFFRF